MSNLCRRHNLFGSDSEPPVVTPATQDTIPEKQAEIQEPDEVTHRNADIPQREAPHPEAPQFDPETIATLREVAAWWKTTSGAGVPVGGMERNEATAEPAYRPRFPGERKNTGIRINKLLLRDALKKAQTPGEAVKTGGGLSPLIERLLWQYLEFDPKYLSREDIKGSDL